MSEDEFNVPVRFGYGPPIKGKIEPVPDQPFNAEKATDTVSEDAEDYEDVRGKLFATMEALEEVLIKVGVVHPDMRDKLVGPELLVLARAFVEPTP